MSSLLPSPAEERAASDLPGPFPVGSYAARLKQRLQQFARVQLVGEVYGVRAGRAKVYFELRDSLGAVPCSIWASDYQLLGVELADGMRVVAGGGCDYYPGSAHASPSFSFAVTELRGEGEGDLLLQLERLRRQLSADGLFEPQKRLPRLGLPRTIGVVTGETGKARDDIVAALRRRGWAGRLVWAFAPVQDRHAAPMIGAALRALAAIDTIDVVIVARGGGSLADLFAFCDETLCRTVALLRVPVISSVGHHTDRTLIDDVAALACSTPTHAAEAAVPVDVAAARAQLTGHARDLARAGRVAVLGRAQILAALARAPAQHVERHRHNLHRLLIDLHSGARRGQSEARRRCVSDAGTLERAAARGAVADAARQRRELDRLRLALAAHDPQRTLQRGYAIVGDQDGRPLHSAAAARAAGELELRFADGAVSAHVADPRA